MMNSQCSKENGRHIGANVTPVPEQRERCTGKVTAAQVCRDCGEFCFAIKMGLLGGAGLQFRLDPPKLPVKHFLIG